MKQSVKRSEARILIFLNNAEPRLKFAAYMAHKLRTEYNFLLLRLREMRYKGWIQRRRSNNKVFYTVTTIAPLEQAKKVLNQPKKLKDENKPI